MAQANQKTFATIRSEIAQEVINASNFTTTDRPTLATVNQFINDAYTDVCNAADWLWMFRRGTFATVVGQTTSYALDDDCAQVLWMTIPARQAKLQKMVYRDWVLANPGFYTNQGNGQPSFYTTAPNEPATDNGMRVFLGPQPADQIYTVEYGYRIMPAVLSADGDYPVVPAPYQDLIKFAALAKIYRFLGPASADSLALAQQSYDALFKKAWMYDQQEPDAVNRWRDIWTENAYSQWSSPNAALFVPY